MQARARHLILMIGWLPVACAGTPPEPLVPRSLTEAAVADAARRTGVAPSAITIRSAERRTWPDGSLGCAVPGQHYTMAQVDGYRVVVQAGAEQLDYRAPRRGVPVLCTGRPPPAGGGGGGAPLR